MRNAFVLLCLAALIVACDSDTHATDWPQTLAIQSDGRTAWRVVIVADVSDGKPVIEVPDYATEVLVMKHGLGSVTVHSSPDLNDYLLRDNGDTLRIQVR